MAIDIDAILAENSDQIVTKVKLRGKVWRFQHVSNLPMSLFLDDISNSQEEMQRLALMLSNAVDPKQRAAFAKLELTVREAQALWSSVIADQQGLTPGESEASPASS